tara:strand:- start:55 stop:252 length:198 start_codon:yes stop_codon:yes gene_type:complete
MEENLEEISRNGPVIEYISQAIANYPDEILYGAGTFGVLATIGFIYFNIRYREDIEKFFAEENGN